MYQRRNQKRKKYFGLYENKELLYLCNVAKTVFSGTFIVLNSYITKKSQISKQCLQLPP